MAVSPPEAMSDSTVEDAVDLATIHDLVQRRHVCWEVFPENAETDQGLVRIGFELDLLGEVDRELDESHVGSADEVYRDLLTIARWVATDPPPRHRYVICPFDASVEFSPRRRFRPEVTLAIDVVHGDPWDEPADEHLLTMLKHVEEKLRAIGAKPERW